MIILHRFRDTLIEFMSRAADEAEEGGKSGSRRRLTPILARYKKATENINTDATPETPRICGLRNSDFPPVTLVSTRAIVFISCSKMLSHLRLKRGSPICRPSI
jgi:hypothetical protein